MACLVVNAHEGGVSWTDLRMEPLEQFFTDEFFRYSAECRRLGRLARSPRSEASLSKRQIWVERLGELRRYMMGSAGARPQHAFVARAVRMQR